MQQMSDVSPTSAANGQQPYFPTLNKQTMAVGQLNRLPFSKAHSFNNVEQAMTQPLFKMVKSDTRLIKLTLEANDFRQTEQNNNFSVCWLGNINNQANKYQFFDNLNEFQKINHFPMSTEITRKDRLAANIKKMQLAHGSKIAELDMIPETYVLPEQMQEFKEAFLSHSSQPQNIWIVKPSAMSNFITQSKNNCKLQLVMSGAYLESYQQSKSLNQWRVDLSMSQGKGIFISNNLNEICQNVSLLSNQNGQLITFVVSRYISNPMLINSLKFDLRIYVLVTSFEPCLRAYVYHEGLVRFATEPFSLHNLNQQCSHLTNYSINKKHTNFFVGSQQPQEGDMGEDSSPGKQKAKQGGVKANVGNKWSLGALNRHMQDVGIDVKLLWNRIYNCINNCLLAGEPQIIQALRRVLPNRQNCFELFGFDVLIDSNLKPWVLEINLSPSLACEAPLDFHIKSRLISDCFNNWQSFRSIQKNIKFHSILNMMCL